MARYQAGAREFTDIEVNDPPAHAPFRGVLLDGLQMRRCFLVVDFGGATLRGADLRGCNLKTWCFDGADLSGADLRDTAIDGATFVGARFDGAMFEGAQAMGHTFTAGELPNTGDGPAV